MPLVLRLTCILNPTLILAQACQDGDCTCIAAAGDNKWTLCMRLLHAGFCAIDLLQTLIRALNHSLPIHIVQLGMRGPPASMIFSNEDQANVPPSGS